MKIITLILVTLIAGCSTVATYTHSKDTHERAVLSQMRFTQPPVMPVNCPGDMQLYFTVQQSGELGSVYVRGGCPESRKRVLWLVQHKAPFPPHREPQDLEYTFGVRHASSY